MLARFCVKDSASINTLSKAYDSFSKRGGHEQAAARQPVSLLKFGFQCPRSVCDALELERVCSAPLGELLAARRLPWLGMGLLLLKTHEKHKTLPFLC